MPRPPLPPNDRILRVATILLFVPAFALLVPHAIAFHHLLPILGIVPSTFSILLGILCVACRMHRAWYLMVLDTSIAIFQLAVLIPTWVEMVGAWQYGRSAVMLGTYGTVPLMAEFCIHTWFVLRELPELLAGQRSRECPHCHNEIEHASRSPAFRREGPGSVYGPVATKETFNPLPRENGYGHGYADVRESSDFQTSGFPTPRVSAETLGSGADNVSLVRLSE